VDWRRVGLVAGTYLGFLFVFGIFVAARGADPLSVYATMVRSTLLSEHALVQTLLRAVPIALAALAVAVPARAGLINVGGEGQLIVGAVAATGAGLLIGGRLPGPASWLLLASLIPTAPANRKVGRWPTARRCPSCSVAS
jgi:general nucleoside transport system permease protein